MVWAFRVSAVATVGLILSAAFLLTRSFLGFAGKDAAIAGLILTGIAMLLGGVTGYLYSATHFTARSSNMVDSSKATDGQPADEPSRSGRLALIAGIVGVVGFGVATVYSLVTSGDVGAVIVVGLLLSALNVLFDVLIRRQR